MYLTPSREQIAAAANARAAARLIVRSYRAQRESFAAAACYGRAADGARARAFHELAQMYSEALQTEEDDFPQAMRSIRSKIEQGRSRHPKNEYCSFPSSMEVAREAQYGYSEIMRHALDHWQGVVAHLRTDTPAPATDRNAGKAAMSS